MREPYEFVQLESAGPVATITLSRPDKLNALNGKMVRELRAAFNEVEADPNTRVSIVRGNGKAFAAGADISEYSHATTGDFDRFTALCNKLCQEISGSEKPVIAAVHGVALGGGFEVALSCDVIVASESATFGLPEVKLGLLPGWGGTQRLTQLIGPNRAKGLIMTAGRLDADQALGLGIVHSVTTDERLQADAAELAVNLSEGAPLAIAAIKSAINRAIANGDGNAGAGYEIEQGHVRRLFLTADGREGIRAFVEKRSPRFTGG